RADQTVPLILRHDRLDGGQLGHLMPEWLGILALQGVVAAGALLGLDRHHGVHMLDGDACPCLSRMARLSPALATTGHTAGALLQRAGWITRRWPRGVVCVLLEALQQLLDGRLQRCNTRFEGPDVLLDSNGRLRPQLWREWRCGVHGL